MSTALSINAIDLHYGAAQALKSVSITCKPGRITAVLGRNGVGKSSTLRAVAGINAITAGSIAFGDEILKRSPPYKRARMGLGYVPQGREIFPLLTVKENLETGYAGLPRADRTIPPYIFELFPVLKSMLGRRGGDLSGGQQQQLAIARALAARPRVLILDEPTEGIQPSIIKDIERVIRLLAARGDMGILLVEQYYDFARALADQYAVMARGEIRRRGAGADMDRDGVRELVAI